MKNTFIWLTMHLITLLTGSFALADAGTFVSDLRPGVRVRSTESRPVLSNESQLFDFVDSAEVILTTDDGGIIVGGVSANFVNANSDNDWWLRKFNKDGTLDPRWNHRFDAVSGYDSLRSGTMDRDGNVYLVGSYTRPDTEQRSIWIKKFGVTGEEIWDKKIAASAAGKSEALTVATNSEGHVVVGGYAENLVNQNSGLDLWIEGYDRNGAKLDKWSIAIDKSAKDQVTSLAFDHEGALYVAGLGSGLVSESSYQDVFLQKFSRDGKPVANWYKLFDSKNVNQTDPVIAISGGGSLLLGMSSFIPENNKEMLLSIQSYQLDGTLNWSQEILDWFGTKINALGIDDKDNIYATGNSYIWSTITTYKLLPSGVVDKSFNKTVESQNILGSNGANDLAIGKDGQIYLAGFAFHLISENSERDAWILRLDKNGFLDEVWQKRIQRNEIASGLHVGGRVGHSLVLGEDELYIYGGEQIAGSMSSCCVDAARYNLNTKRARTLETPNNFYAKNSSAVMANGKIIAWGGGNYFWGDVSAYGVIIDPKQNQSTPMSLENVPQARAGHTAHWTGKEMIVWGGGSTSEEFPQNGGIYDPATDSWRAMSTEIAPVGRVHHTSVWTEKEMIVWGGRIRNDDRTVPTATGGIYNPITDSWTEVTDKNAPSPRLQHTAVWTGKEMLVWGGKSNDHKPYNDGHLFDPKANSWRPISQVGAPSERSSHVAVWTGSKMIVWGGDDGRTDTLFNDGGIYDPATDTWAPLSLTNPPVPRSSTQALWTGVRMVIFGGVFWDEYTRLPSLFSSYDPASNTWEHNPSNP